MKRKQDNRKTCRPGKCRWSWIEAERVAKCDACGFSVRLTSESLIRIMKGETDAIYSRKNPDHG